MSLSWLGREVSRMARNSRIRRTFTPQFKKEAVALLKQGRSATDVAQSLGIALLSLRGDVAEAPPGVRADPLLAHDPARSCARTDRARPPGGATPPPSSRS